MPKLIPFTLAFCLCCIACNHTKIKIEEPRSSGVLLVFKDQPRDFMYHYKSGRRSGSLWTLAYVDDLGIYHRVLHDGTPLPDTLHIQVGARQHVELLHNVLGGSQLRYLLQSGDTVTFTYDSIGLPIARSAISEQLTFSYNLYTQRLFINAHENHSAVELLSLNGINQMMHWLKKNDPNQYINIFGAHNPDYINLDSIEAVARGQFLADRHYYDSLRKSGALSDCYYGYIKYLRKLDSMVLWNPLPIERKGRHKPPYDVSEFVDSLVFYPSSISLLSDYFFSVETRRPNVRWLKRTGYSGVNFVDVFNSIAKNDSLTAVQKDLMLYFCMECIIEGSPVSDIQQYLKQFLAITSDSAKHSYLIEEHNIDFSNSADLLLMDVEGGSNTFTDLIAQSRGKVIYVDFWASGCAPCCAGMPAAKKLRAEYAGKDVVFLYLALNDKEAPWRRAIATLEMTDNSYNYLITNFRTSKMLEELKVQSIPRYLLYNRQGQLVRANAPRPESEEIRGLLDKYLAE